MKHVARWQMTRAHRIAATLLILVLLVALIGACSISGDDDDDTNANASPEAGATTVATAAADTATEAGTDDVTPSGTEPAGDGTPAASPATTPATGVGDPPITVVTVQDILENTQAHIDQAITLDADVADTIDDLAFTVTDAGADQPLLVVGAPGVIPADLDPGAYVRVAGAVRTFDQPAIELAIGAGLDDDAFDDFAGMPVILADEVRIGLVSVDGLLGNPAAYENRRVTVTGPIGEIFSPWSFTLASRDVEAEVLVVAPFRAIAPGVAADKWMRATGTVRLLDPDDDAFSGDLEFLFEDDTYARYLGKPVVVLDLLEVLSDDTTTTVGAIASDPAAFAGQTIIVSDGVGAVLATQAFTLEADGQRILVVAREGTLPRDLTAGAVVLVSGTVDQFSISGSNALVWQALGINTSDPAFAALDGAPAIIADSINLVAVANGP